MKSILLAFDGKHFSQSLLDFALKMHLSEPVLLTGIFLPSRDYLEAMSYFYYDNPIMPLYLREEEDDPQRIEQNIRRFVSFCQQHHISFRVCKKGRYQHIVAALQEETRYADLLLISSTRFYENMGATIQEEYLKETMHRAECPILLLPDDFIMPERNIIAYDGSASCMHALKQYIYLLPAFTKLNTHFIYIEEQKKGIPNEVQIHNYAATHFSSLAYYDLNFDPKEYFTTWIENEKAAIMVCGSYGRTAFSELFHRNFAIDVVREHKVPIFIAHL